ncbi:hypothetical protein M9H77_31533 [Catharanthus roseus]|uniref:Uncharacterized protein n=1 Tax=Catharanthus roseus TaxID=4058 RepID=A0ACC0A491_CATRO|nr:hypothetical protein M9H77_31533 [Catharanthus roseus]
MLIANSRKSKQLSTQLLEGAAEIRSNLKLKQNLAAEIERTLKTLRAQRKITNTCDIKIAENSRALRDRRDDGKLPSHPIENPRANYHEQAKAVITFRNKKLVDNKIGETIKDDKLNENEIKGINMGTKIKRKIENELASSSNSKTLESSPTASYKPKFVEILKYHILCKLSFL